MIGKYIPLTLLLLTFIQGAFSQEEPASPLHFEVQRVYPSFWITREKLRQAQTLNDLNKHYKPSWVRMYISVEVTTKEGGEKKLAVGGNDTLSREQKNIMMSADPGEEISVVIRYMPDNMLLNNEPKEERFTLAVEPVKSATYKGGQKQLRRYLKEEAIAWIAEGTFVNYDLSAIKFTIDEEGRVIDAEIFWPFEKKKVDELLLEVICNMPAWIPAEYADGTRIKQKFVLLVGNMKNCAVQMLNIDRGC